MLVIFSSASAKIWSYFLWLAQSNKKTEKLFKDLNPNSQTLQYRLSTLQTWLPAAKRWSVLDSGVEETDGETRCLVIQLGILESVGLGVTYIVACLHDLIFDLPLVIPGCLFCLGSTETQGEQSLQLGCARKPRCVKP